MESAPRGSMPPVAMATASPGLYFRLRHHGGGNNLWKDAQRRRPLFIGSIRVFGAHRESRRGWSDRSKARQREATTSCASTRPQASSNGTDSAPHPDDGISNASRHRRSALSRSMTLRNCCCSWGDLVIEVDPRRSSPAANPSLSVEITRKPSAREVELSTEAPPTATGSTSPWLYPHPNVILPANHRADFSAQDA